MKRHYTAVVLGAGPAGAACGISLQKNGVNHCVLDKAVFPRKKTCAGLVTGKTFRLLQALYDGAVSDALFCDTADTVRLLRGKEEIAAAAIKQPVRLVNRETFDNALTECYRSLGGTLYEGVRVSVDTKNHRLLLQNGDELYYDNLIFADGALSLSRKLYAVAKRRLAFGAEIYLPTEKLPSKSVDLYFGYIANGYIWTFPHGDSVCVGAAGAYDQTTDYRAILTRFLAERGIDAADGRIVGAFLPYGTPVPQQNFPEDVMLVGDAGGFADPISGEGLYMALQTGIYAAQAVKTQEPKRRYLQAVRPLLQIIRDGRRVQKLFYHPAVHSRLLHRVQGNSRAVRFYFDAQVDDYRYTYRQMHKLYKDYKRSR